MQLVFATHNKNKFKEVAALMPNSIDLLSLDMIGCFEDIKETGTTLEENAKLKSDYIFRKYKRIITRNKFRYIKRHNKRIQ